MICTFYFICIINVYMYFYCNWQISAQKKNPTREWEGMGVILPGVDGTGFSPSFFMGLGREEINFCGSGTGEAWEFTPVSPCICAAHSHLCQLPCGHWMCCSSQPEPALTDQGRHRERCNSRSRAHRIVLATFGKLLRFFQKSLDLSLGA